MHGEFVMKRMVQFAETDLAGVLHFANYYRMMEEVEHAFWRSLGSRVVIGNDEVTLSWPRVATGCEYFSPAHFEDELELAFTVAHVGERSATFEVQFRRNGERIARGKTTAVCCAMSKGTFRPVVIPDEIRRKLTRSISPAKSTAG